ncbi:MAG TPA: threo-3-hydroxy-L-aspartate ammonia-lyase, partial [Aggregatilineaceae bacterium]|nr:threo-3-hydroxy-L-aspartate ammonia-lyase [Aggregatilineaceae bacterium]
ERLRGHAHRTPIHRSRTLDALAGAEILLKCENFQRGGAFKFRGAFNAISLLSGEQRARGVITYSSGNHAQAIALAGRLLGAQTTVVMPDNAPAIKRAATEGYGARVVPYDPATGDRQQIAEALAAERGYTIIPPYDDANIVAGQGTAALELLQDAGSLDWLLVPCGGGGLLSGSAIAAKGLAPQCRVVGIEPELADDATRSFHTRTLHTVHNPPTLADGTRTPSLGAVTFPLVLEYVDDMRTVSEDAIVEAVRFLFYRAKLVVEPSGALGVAALLSGAIQASGRVGVILSGGNIDGPTMARLLSG